MKITEKQFIAKRKKLADKQDAYKEKIGKEYNLLINLFFESEFGLKDPTGKVYEIIEGQKTPRGCQNRFVVYARDVTHHVFSNDDDSSFFSFRLDGWWLDQNNSPKKWDNLILKGFANVVKVQLCEDQTHLPHPNSSRAHV